MAHFARLDKNNIVTNVVVINNSDCLDNDGIESEATGIAFCQKLFDSSERWLQTSYNGNFRKRFAGIGYKYDEQNDVFISTPPFPSWELNSDLDWEAPVPKPAYEWVQWDEDTLSWIDISNPNIGEDGIDYSLPDNDWEVTHPDWQPE